MITRGRIESKWNTLWPLFKHHFNLKHLLGVVNWHLPRCGTHKHAVINVSALTFPLLICFRLSSLFLLPFSCLPCSSPCTLVHPLYPFCHTSPPSVCLSPEDYTTYSHERICVILPLQLRQTYLRILGGGSVFCDAPSCMRMAL